MIFPFFDNVMAYGLYLLCKDIPYGFKMRKEISACYNYKTYGFLFPIVEKCFFGISFNQIVNKSFWLPVIK